jgi:hypothetical protein
MFYLLTRISKLHNASRSSCHEDLSPRISGGARQGMNGCLNNFTKDAELEFCSRNDGYFCALNPRSDACPQRG